MDVIVCQIRHDVQIMTNTRSEPNNATYFAASRRQRWRGSKTRRAGVEIYRIRRVSEREKSFNVASDCEHLALPDSLTIPRSTLIVCSTRLMDRVTAINYDIMYNINTNYQKENFGKSH